MPIRERVEAALQEAPYLMPWAFETAPASSENVEDGYLRKVCDIGDPYGGSYPRLTMLRPEFLAW
jgi:hypothetical protein